jgi:prophage regulatory protein
MAEGKFPASVSIGARAVAWVEEEIDAWIEERIAERAKRVRNIPKRGEMAAA